MTDRLAGYAEGTQKRREALATLAPMRRVIAQRQAAEAEVAIGDNAGPISMPAPRG